MIKDNSRKNGMVLAMVLIGLSYDIILFFKMQENEIIDLLK